MLADRFTKIAVIFDQTAPVTSAHARRIAQLAPLQKLADKACKDYGDTYCGGEIEAFLRKVAGEEGR